MVNKIAEWVQIIGRTGLGTLPSQTPTIESSIEDNEPGDLEEIARETEVKTG